MEKEMKNEFILVDDNKERSSALKNSLVELNHVVSSIFHSTDSVHSFLEKKKKAILIINPLTTGLISGFDLYTICRKKLQITVILITDDLNIKNQEIFKNILPHGLLNLPASTNQLSITISVAINQYLKEQECTVDDSINKNSSSDFVFVKISNKLIKLAITEIFYIEALKDYVSINTVDKRFTIHATMKDLELKLAKYNFVRIHRSYIVQLEKISTIELPNIHLEEIKKTLPLSASYKEELLLKINTL